MLNTKFSKSVPSSKLYKWFVFEFWISLNCMTRKTWDCRHSNWNVMIVTIKTLLTLKKQMGTQLKWVATLFFLFVLKMTGCSFLALISSIFLQSVLQWIPYLNGILLHLFYKKIALKASSLWLNKPCWSHCSLMMPFFFKRNEWIALSRNHSQWKFKSLVTLYKSSIIAKTYSHIQGRIQTWQTANSRQFSWMQCH